jgi:hypothetical protein
MSAARSIVRPGSLRPPGSDTYVDRRFPVIEWTPNSTAGSSRINYGALTISAPHRITNIHVVSGGTDPRPNARGTIRPC